MMERMRLNPYIMYALFFDKKHKRNGEYCIAETKEDAINELLKFFNGTIEEMQKILNRWKKNTSNLREMLKPTE